jgi:hypothetical protein
MVSTCPYEIMLCMYVCVCTSPKFCSNISISTTFGTNVMPMEATPTNNFQSPIIGNNKMTYARTAEVGAALAPCNTVMKWSIEYTFQKYATSVIFCKTTMWWSF